MANDQLTVEACYLYPVKGMTPVSNEALDLQTGRSPRGDRAFVFAFADAELQGNRGWVSKRDAVTLLTTPALAAVESQYDPDARRLTLSAASHGESTGQIDTPEDRVALAAWLADVVKQVEDEWGP